jgi:hypothetical protein
MSNASVSDINPGTEFLIVSLNIPLDRAQGSGSD